MKAFLLAAGLGTRLWPITETIPKCMVPIGGRPLLDIWRDSLAVAGVDEVLINLHHRAEVIWNHVQEWRGPPMVRMVYEQELLGSAGTLVKNKGWVDAEEMILVCNADNLTNFDLRSLIDAHRKSGAIATLTLFHAERPSECGVVEIDDSGRMIAFSEKPDEPTGDLANAGIYAFDPCVIDLVLGPPPNDIGYDILPLLVGRAQTVIISDYFRDIGTPEALQRAQHEWAAPARS
jgi:mannose-1-phosphate guanylyltransferase